MFLMFNDYVQRTPSDSALLFWAWDLRWDMTVCQHKKQKIAISFYFKTQKLLGAIFKLPSSEF